MRARRHRRHVELLAVPQLQRLDRVAGLLADDVELALERVLVHRRVDAARDEDLPDDRLDFLRALGQARVVASARRASRAGPGLRLAIARSISCSQAIRDAGSCGRNTMPTPYWPTAGSVMPCLPHASRRNGRAAGSGCRRRRLAADRRPSRRGASGSRGSCRPCVTIACAFAPLMWAMKPRPHASCSFAGS